MGLETEYRFLLFAPPPVEGVAPQAISQGYLSTDPDRVVRVRRMGEKAFLTVKGRKKGATAPEFEYEIPAADAGALLELCGENRLTKDRYALFGPDGRRWDVDVFTGRHQGLIIAEIEVPGEGVAFTRPGWLDGVEITTDPRLGNARLVSMTGDELEKILTEYRL